MPRHPYIHLIGDDVPIWEAFLPIYGKNFQRFDYDVHVGQGAEPDPDLPEQYQRMIRVLSKLRIDAIGYKEDEIWIIEVKKEAGLTALGQIMGYLTLYREEYQPTKQLKGAVVTNFLRPDIKHLLEVFGISYFVIPIPLG